MSDLSDFNLLFLPVFGNVQFIVAGRFYDIAPDKWERLACEWYGRHGFKELLNDKYFEGNMVRYKSVDALVSEDPKELGAVGQHLFDSWLAKKAALAKRRNTPPVVILPPKPESPILKPVPKPMQPKPPPDDKSGSKPDIGRGKKGTSKVTLYLIVFVLALVTICYVVSFFVPVLAPLRVIIGMLIRVIGMLIGSDLKIGE